MTHQRAYVDRRVPDVEAAREAAAGAARHWGLESPEFFRHGMNAIFRCGDTVLRVASPTAPAERSIELSDVLAGHGISVLPPARRDVVRHGGLSVTAWPHVEASDVGTDWAAVGAMVRRVHRIDAAELPSGLPAPSPVVFPWWRFEEMLSDVEEAIDEAARAGLRDAIDRHEGWGDFAEQVVCHGDVHPGNVIMSPDGPVLIDWDLLCLAPPAWDHAPMLTWTERWGGEAEVYEDFADGYGWSGRDDPVAEGLAELRLVAATLMRVKAGLLHPAAMPEAQRRLRHWRGESEAPTWRAQ